MQLFVEDPGNVEPPVRDKAPEAGGPRCRSADDISKVVSVCVVCVGSIGRSLGCRVGVL